MGKAGGQQSEDPVKHLNPNLHPPGGFRFVDARGVTHVGDTLEKLVSHLASYRKRNGFPVGDPQREVEEQICDTYPHLCGSSFNGRMLASRVVSNLVEDVTRRGFMLVSPEEAKRRAAICAKCPMNVNWAEHCPPCKRKAKQFLPHLVRPNKPYKRLIGRACHSAGDDLSVAVWLLEGRLVGGAPAECWRRDTADPSSSQTPGRFL